MNPEKRKGYKLKASQHTTQIRTTDLPIILPANDKFSPFEGCISHSSIYSDKDGVVNFKSRINANNLSEMGDIYSYSLFKLIFNGILDDMGINDYKIIRADMRFDSTEKTFYEEYAKLNRYLISMIAYTYDVKNCYKTLDLWSDEQLSIAIKNNDFELENYDKKAESIRKGFKTDITSRLEERSKSHNTNEKWTVEDINNIFGNRWFGKWNKAIKNRKAVCDKYNNALINTYNKEINSNFKKWKNLNQFLRIHQDQIFTRKQMIDLLQLLGENNAEQKADKFKEHNPIEYFSKADITYAINEIKRATIEYLLN